MNIATQLEHVMSLIWGNENEPLAPTLALASYVKNHNRRNHENVFEVIDILWPESTRTIKQRDGQECHGGADYIVDVQFDDDSQVMVICRNGIGNGIEFMAT